VGDQLNLRGVHFHLGESKRILNIVL
jgi:hypothetical protein